MKPDPTLLVECKACGVSIHKDAIWCTTCGRLNPFYAFPIVCCTAVVWTVCLMGLILLGLVASAWLVSVVSSAV